MNIDAIFVVIARAGSSLRAGRLVEAEMLYTYALFYLVRVPGPVSGETFVANETVALSARDKNEGKGGRGRVEGEDVDNGKMCKGGGVETNGEMFRVARDAARPMDEAENGPSLVAERVRRNGCTNASKVDREQDEGEGEAHGATLGSNMGMASVLSGQKLYPRLPEHHHSGPMAAGSETRDLSLEAHATVALLTKRSLIYLMLKRYRFAISDATEALALNPSHTKSLLYRAMANLALGYTATAKKEFHEIHHRLKRSGKPGLDIVQAKLAECDKVLHAERLCNVVGDGECNFESKGSAERSGLDNDVDENMEITAPAGGGADVSACEAIDEKVLMVERAYTGPILAASDTVDENFIMGLIEFFRGQGVLPLKYAVPIVLQAKAIFETHPNIVEIPVRSGSRITICGDVHGQFYDVIDGIFAGNGLPSVENPYVFNGDFVDRGSFSVEVMLLLLSLKVACPSSMYLTRGNHESTDMTERYGFKKEVEAKYGSDLMYKMFTELFKSLPLGYILDGTVEGRSDGKRALVVHGGLFSRDGVTIADLQQLNRRCEPGYTAENMLMTEMLWSDVQNESGRQVSKRGCSFSFGPDVTHRFLNENNLDILVRSHEMKREGFEVTANGRLITVFSAPNYCGSYGNKGAFVSFDCTMKPEFTQFSAATRPNVRVISRADGTSPAQPRDGKLYLSAWGA